MTDEDLRRDIAAELCWDPQVDSAAIEVSAASGHRHAARDRGQPQAQAGGGKRRRPRLRVNRVANELKVQIPDRDRRDDEDLRGDVLEALMLEGSVPMTVDAQARDGFVTLTGTVEWHYQREAAESRTAGVPGVVGINNAIALAQAPDALAAGDAISRAFRRDAVLDADGLYVETFSGGLVILSGTVSSWAAHDHAVAAAWSAAGVTDVDDRIGVEYAP